ncbi:hypothetical protein EBQ90_05720 [bacterium]|nr:hypothetical protein [bacterium]
MRSIFICVLILLSGCSFLELDSSSGSPSDRELASSDEPLKVQKERNREESLKESIRQNPEEPTKQSLRKRILVLPMKNLSTVGGDELSQFATDEIKNRVAQVDEFVLVPNLEIPNLNQLNPDASETDLNSVLEIARAHGVAAVVWGNIKAIKIRERGNQVGIFQTRYNTVQAMLDVKMVDVVSKKVTIQKEVSAEVTEENTRFFGNRSIASSQASRAEGAVSEALDQMISSFTSEAHRIGWSGRIAKIDVHRYYINAGELSGVSKHQLLRVFGDAEPVIDKESGLVIGMAPGRFKGLLKVVDFFGEDGAIAIVHSGAGFQEKDRVEAFTPPQP